MHAPHNLPVVAALAEDVSARNQALTNLQAIRMWASARDTLSQRFAALLHENKPAAAAKLKADVTAKVTREVRFLCLANRVELGCANEAARLEHAQLLQEREAEGFDPFTFLESLTEGAR